MSALRSKIGKTRAQTVPGATAADPDEGDILVGGDAITEYLRGLLANPHLSRSTVYRWLSQRYLPCSSIGALKTASKSILREHFRKTTVAGLREIGK